MTEQLFDLFFYCFVNLNVQFGVLETAVPL